MNFRFARFAELTQRTVVQLRTAALFVAAAGLAAIAGGALALKLRGDRAAIIQLTIDLPALQAYFHAERILERKPLLILQNQIIGGAPGVTKFGQPVQFLPRSEIGNKAPLEFTRIRLAGRTAWVEFRYPVEGIHGRVRFIKSGGTWTVHSHRLQER